MEVGWVSNATVIVELSERNLWKLAEILHERLLKPDNEITRKACEDLLQELSQQTTQITLDPYNHVKKSKLDIEQVSRAEALTLIGVYE
jgi:hypothetical protein